jgi:hypothetical protein
MAKSQAALKGWTLEYFLTRLIERAMTPNGKKR